MLADNRLLAISSKNVIHLKSKTPPVVEFDSEACAAYARFSREAIAKTEILHSDGVEVTINLDANGDAIGIELIGVSEFTVETLMKVSGLTVSPDLLKDVRYARPGAHLASA